jgi:mono/diheme cytochrome c family protein
MSKRYDAKRGETNAFFIFNVTNRSPAEVIVTALRPSCGCTVAKVPSLPWQLASGTNGQMEINVDLRGRNGLLRKLISVESSAGTNVITVDVQLPELDEREKNRLAAFADRQGVFKNDCAKCHLEPAVGKKGGELYKVICAICHESEHRAAMVPNLASLKKPTDKAYWDQWIHLGKPGTFMPAFSKPFGGPLEETEIASLVNYLLEHFPSSGSPLTPEPGVLTAPIPLTK